MENTAHKYLLPLATHVCPLPRKKSAYLEDSSFNINLHSTFITAREKELMNKIVAVTGRQGILRMLPNGEQDRHRDALAITLARV